MKKNAQPTATDIMGMDDRPTFTVEVPEWGLVGDNAAIVRQPDVYTIACIEESCDSTPRGRAIRAARIAVEGCVSPKFGQEHVEALATTKNPVALGRIVAAIMMGPKKKLDSKA